MAFTLTSLPIVERELYVASRRRLTFWTRMAAAFIAVGLGFFVLLTHEEISTAASGFLSTAPAGQKLFRSLTSVAFFATLFAGILLTADSISSERREGTLGLLFLTDLKGYDVVLGKLAALSLRAIYCLLAMLPVMAVPLLMGGVSFGEYVRAAVVLLDSLLLSLAVGLFTSSFCQDRQAAYVAAEAVLLLLVTLGVMLGPILAPLPFLEPLCRFLWLASPLALFYEREFLGTTQTFDPDFFISLFTQFGLALALLAAACWRVPRSWQIKSPRRLTASVKSAWQRVQYGNPARRTALRRRLLDRNPLCWLGSRDQLLHGCLWILTGVVLALSLLANCTGAPWFEPSTAVGSLILIHAVLSFLVAMDAGGRFGELRRDGLLQLIWGTRLSVAEIAQGQLLAMRRLLGGPVLAALAYDFFWLCMVIHDGLEPTRIALVLGFPCVIGILLWDLHALAWTGLWAGLKARRAPNAAYAAIFQIILLPLLGLGVVALITRMTNTVELFAIWAAFSALANWVFTFRARWRLNHEFHRRVQDRVEDAPSQPASLNENYAMMNWGGKPGAAGGR